MHGRCTKYVMRLTKILMIKSLITHGVMLHTDVEMMELDEYLPGDIRYGRVKIPNTHLPLLSLSLFLLFPSLSPLFLSFSYLFFLTPFKHPSCFLYLCLFYPHRDVMWGHSRIYLCKHKWLTGLCFWTLLYSYDYRILNIDTQKLSTNSAKIVGR